MSFFGEIDTRKKSDPQPILLLQAFANHHGFQIPPSPPPQPRQKPKSVAERKTTRNNKQNEKVLCECGHPRPISRSNIAQHRKSKIHNERLAGMNRKRRRDDVLLWGPPSPVSREPAPPLPRPPLKKRRRETRSNTDMSLTYAGYATAELKSDITNLIIQIKRFFDLDLASRDFCYILEFFSWDSVVNGLKTVWRLFLMKIHIISTIVILDVDIFNILGGFP